MKHIRNIRIIIAIPALLLGLIATAQRGDRGGMIRGNTSGIQQSQPRDNSGASQQSQGGFERQKRTLGSPANQPVPDYDAPRKVYQPNRTDAAPVRTDNANTPAFRNDQRPQRSFENRPMPSKRLPERNYPAPQPQERTIINGNNDSRSYTNVERYHSNDGYNRRYYNRHSYPSPYRYSYSYPRFGERYPSLNFRYNVIPFDGLGYYYYNGIFYRPFGNYYQVVLPPRGITIDMLPRGYTRFFMGGCPYYHYGGIYYREYGNYFQVVDPPLGAKLPALPVNATEIFINGQRFFEDNGTYYLETYNSREERMYTVVGVDGVPDQRMIERVMYGSNEFFESGSDYNY